jgi:hypothetical protein
MEVHGTPGFGRDLLVEGAWRVAIVMGVKEEFGRAGAPGAPRSFFVMGDWWREEGLGAGLA